MKRRELLERSAVLGLAAALPGWTAAASAPAAGIGNAPSPLQPPATGSIPVAFLVSEGAVVIDFCGPWEVFQDVNVPGRDGEPFQLYTVAETRQPIHTSGGMEVVPAYTFETARLPKVLVIPAQGGRCVATLAWIRRAAAQADVTMSVCTGALLLAGTGLLSGKSATTHHTAYKTLALENPDVRVERGARFVEQGHLATAGGLSSGIDLALRVVERYFGRETAEQTAYQMEYQGQGWLDAGSNKAYATVRSSTDAHPLCPICDMDTDPKAAPKSVYEGKTYYFCSTAHKEQFDRAPATIVRLLAQP